MEKEEELIPARMLNEYVYCPRLGYLEWVDGEFVHSVDTLFGKMIHKRVDKPSGALPDIYEVEKGIDNLKVRSLTLSNDELKIIAKIDLIEGKDKEVYPVDYKKGKKPDIKEQAWEPERVQLCAQGLILRGNGYKCSKGIIFYFGSHVRVEIEFNEELIATTIKYINRFRESAKKGIPPPLIDSKKCLRCSLKGICLPDEVSYLTNERIKKKDIRRLIPARTDLLPVYLQKQGSTIGYASGRLEIREKGEKTTTIRLSDVSSVTNFGNINITPRAFRELMGNGIPICHLSYGGWFYGISHGFLNKNIELRREQFLLANDKEKSLALAKQFVLGKIRNSRTLLRRNSKKDAKDAIKELTRIAIKVSRAKDINTLLGLEGFAAKIYFSKFQTMFTEKEGKRGLKFNFLTRNKRPPKDPVNAMLSFGYALLVKDLTIILLSSGFDPFMGIFHQIKYGKPALALDLIEEFRPIIVDSVVIGTINRGELTIEDFIISGVGVAIKPDARKKFIKAYERRMDETIIHPIFGYKISYRRILEVQTRLLGRCLMGEIPKYPPFCTR